MVGTVEGLAIKREIAAVKENAQLHGWLFERVGERCFRVSLSARNGDNFHVQVEFDGFPVQPASFHWWNRETSQFDDVADSPKPYDFFFPTGEICAPWNRLASRGGGPHPEWKRASWMQHPNTKGTVTLAAMVLRIHHELRSDRYQGRRKC